MSAGRSRLPLVHGLKELLQKSNLIVTLCASHDAVLATLQNLRSDDAQLLAVGLDLGQRVVLGADGEAAGLVDDREAGANVPCELKQ